MLPCTYKPPDVQHMVRQLKWFNGQISNYDPTSGQYGVFFPSDKDVKFLD